MNANTQPTAENPAVTRATRTPGYATRIPFPKSTFHCELCGAQPHEKHKCAIMFEKLKALFRRKKPEQPKAERRYTGYNPPPTYAKPVAPPAYCDADGDFRSEKDGA